MCACVCALCTSMHMRYENCRLLNGKLLLRFKRASRMPLLQPVTTGPFLLCLTLSPSLSLFRVEPFSHLFACILRRFSLRIACFLFSPGPTQQQQKILCKSFCVFTIYNSNNSLARSPGSHSTLFCVWMAVFISFSTLPTPSNLYCCF